MEFYGRKDELQKLTSLVLSEELECGIILGRRRIGKSELVKQVLNKTGCKSIYYECKTVSEKSNVESLSFLVSEIFDLPSLEFKNIESLLEFLFRYGEKEKLVIVLDEYPYLRETAPGVDSVLQTLIDKYKKTSKAKIILLGSHVAVMNSLLEHSNPLYGRVNLTIDLKQLNYLETSNFYPNYCPADKIKLYSVFGGIPYYNELIDQSLSVRENIIRLIASEGARLENEVEMYLGSEISKIPNANQTFDALARGFTKYSDILSQSHVSSGPTLIDVLDKLIRMEVVSKGAPINEEWNRRKTSYRISDNLSLFYYKYIFRYSSQMSVMNEDDFYDKYIEEDFEKKYVPHQFEDICKQYLIMKNKRSEVNPPFFKIGKYYYDDPTNKTNGEFDIVTEDEKGYVFYEVKFQDKPLSIKAIEDEVRQVNNTSLKCYKHVFISKSGFDCDAPKNTEFIDLEELFKN